MGIKELYAKYRAWKDRPPTPDETKQAENHLRIVWDYYAKTVEKTHFPDTALTLLGQATLSLNKARRLDSSVAYTDEEGRTYSQDALAGTLLYWEGWYLNARADHEAGNFSDASQIKDAENNSFKSYTKAAKALEKSIKYQPMQNAYNLLIGLYHVNLKNKKRARDLLKEALKRDPNDLDTLKLASQMQPTWRRLLGR